MKIHCPKCNAIVDTEADPEYAGNEPDFAFCTTCDSIISLKYDQYQLAEEKTSGCRFNRWRKAVQAIGHKEFPFLDAVYSPNSRVPCKGFVEWIADAWLVGDIDSIARLFRELVRANPGISFSEDSLIDTFGRLPSDLQRISIEETISGLSFKQIATLLSAYMIQAVVEGYQEEFILISTGRDLMAASILPWDFDIPVADKCITHVNTFINQMRRDTPFWKEVPLYTIQDIVSFNKQKLESLVQLRQLLIPLSTSARMHLLDVICYCKSSLVRRPLENCTFYETRRFGCYTKETSQEIRESGLVIPNVPVNLLENLFKKSELQELLIHRGITFKKTANRAELFALAKERAVDDLLAMSQREGTFTIVDELQYHSKTLIDFCHHRASRLGVWAAGVVVPRLMNLHR